MPIKDENQPPESLEKYPDQIVEISIDGILDLHTFNPKEIRQLLDDYLTECHRIKVLEIRIIHGKGRGILRDTVKALLDRHPLVLAYSQAPPEAGGWGATLVTLKKNKD